MADAMARAWARFLLYVVAMACNREPVPYGRPLRQCNAPLWWPLIKSPTVVDRCGFSACMVYGIGGAIR